MSDPKINNDAQIVFCNAMEELRRHGVECRDCAIYLRWGDGNLCDKGIRIITKHLAFVDTGLEATP